jgi:CRP-like cAMP-binding protein
MFLRRPLAKRQEKDMRELQLLLYNKIAKFNEFSQKQQLLMCDALKYLSVEPGRVIIKEGQSAQNYYIILSGQVEVTQKLD